MLRVALPKGKLLDQTMAFLADRGFGFHFKGDRDYSPRVSGFNARAKVIKVRAIPQLIALGNFHVGFCGLDLIRDAGYENVEALCDLGLNRVTLVVAQPKGSNFLANPPKRPIVIATEYEALASQWALQHGLAHIIIQTWGSTEGYAPEDADIVFDNAETGRTIDANGLEIVESIMDSSTHMVVNKSMYADSAIRKEIDILVKRINQNN